MRTPAGEVRLDPTGRANGRGAYVCAAADCIAAATSRGGLSRALAAPLPASLALELGAAVLATHPTPDPDMTIAGGTRGQE